MKGLRHPFLLECALLYKRRNQGEGERVVQRNNSADCRIAPGGVYRVLRALIWFMERGIDRNARDRGFTAAIEDLPYPRCKTVHVGIKYRSWDECVSSVKVSHIVLRGHGFVTVVVC